MKFSKILRSVLAIVLALLCLVSCTNGLVNQATEPKALQTDTNTESETSKDTQKSTDKNTSNGSAKNTYKITYRNMAGGTIVGTLVQTVEKGKSTTSVTAVPDEGYIFQKWSDGLTGATRREMGVTVDKTLFPIFVKIESLQDNGVPRVFINTDDGRTVTSKEEYKECSVSVDNTEYSLSNSSALIRGRGNSSWTNMPKKSYKIKFDQKTSLFGSEYRAKDWTLIANYCDKSLSRNAIAHELATQFEAIAFASMHEFVEVYVNGQYDGLYLLCDQIETGEGRVDVTEEINTTGDTGYLIEMDARAPNADELGPQGNNVSYFTMSTDSDHYYRLRTPDVDKSYYDPDIYLQFIKSYMEECMELIQMYPNVHNDYANQDIAPEIWDEICEKMDVDSFAEAYIILELMANLDCHAYSFYFYKNKGGKLCSGPLWDFDISSGNNNYGYGFADGAITEAVPDLDLRQYGELWVAQQNRWFRRLLRIAEFNDLVQEKLEKYKDVIEYVISFLDTDESNAEGYYYKYGEAMESNFERWQILGKYDWPNPKALVNIKTVKGQIDYLHNWLTERHAIVRNRFGLV